jgi:hypothetical protein
MCLNISQQLNHVNKDMMLLGVSHLFPDSFDYLLIFSLSVSGSFIVVCSVWLLSAKLSTAVGVCGEAD